MNIIANNVASKLFVAFVATAMIFSIATPAKAATVEELQAQIAALMAQISSLSGGSSSSSAACTFTRALTVGSEGADVKCLQEYLTSTGNFSNAAGATGYFGPVTTAAVAAWQSANGVSPAVGYFGSVSQAKYNMLMAAAPADDSTDDDSTDDSSDDSTDDSSTELSGEASLTTVEVSDGEDADDVEEGSEDIQVAEIVVEFSDGDAEITRLDLALEVDSGNNGDDDPWDVFQDVSLWVDGDEVARMDVTDEDDYLDEDDGSLRFSGLDIVAMEDEEVTIVVAVTVNSSVDGVAASDVEGWNIDIGAIRFVDADDVTTTDTSTGDIDTIAGVALSATIAEFDIELAGEGDDLNVESSDEDPDATTFALDEDSNTEAMVFAFDLSAEDSDGDVQLNDIQVGVRVSSSTLDTIVNDFRLEIAGESYAAESYVGTTNGQILTFDFDGDITIEADDVVTAMLYADFEDMDATEPSNQGTTLIASTTASYIDAEGQEDITVDGSTVTSETHTLRVKGVEVELVDETVTAIENADAATDDEAEFVIEFTVTAFGDAVYLPFGAASSTSLTSGLEFSILDADNAAVSTGIAIASFDMDGDDETNSFKVAEGDTETFTLTVTYDPTTSGTYKVRLDDINFALTDAATATVSQSVSSLNIDTAQAAVTS